MWERRRVWCTLRSFLRRSDLNFWFETSLSRKVLSPILMSITMGSLNGFKRSSNCK